MTEEEFKAYKFDDEHDPSDAHLQQLMENAAKAVRESNRIAEEQFFERLHQACEEAKRRRIS